jgi:hypothetical protein
MNFAKLKPHTVSPLARDLEQGVILGLNRVCVWGGGNLGSSQRWQPPSWLFDCKPGVTFACTSLSLL